MLNLEPTFDFLNSGLRLAELFTGIYMLMDLIAQNNGLMSCRYNSHEAIFH